LEEDERDEETKEMKEMKEMKRQRNEKMEEKYFAWWFLRCYLFRLFVSKSLKSLLTTDY